MARTKAEVRAFLDSLVGSTVVDKSDADLNGQCVTLIKALMEFLGVPNPYAGRGNATDAGNTYIRQGIAVDGRGWLTVCVNHDMGFIGGVHYGHIWIDLLNETNYEENGNRALHVTKGTRPIAQAEQFINFDQWITEEVITTMATIQNNDDWRARCRRSFLNIRGRDMAEVEFQNYVGQDFLTLVEALEDNAEADANINYANLGRQVTSENWGQQIADLQTKLTAAQADDTTDEATIADLKSQIETLQDQIKNTPVVTPPTVPVDDGSSAPTEPPVNTSKLNELIAAIADWFKANFGGKN